MANQKLTEHPNRRSHLLEPQFGGTSWQLCVQSELWDAWGLTANWILFQTLMCLPCLSSNCTSESQPFYCYPVDWASQRDTLLQDQAKVLMRPHPCREHHQPRMVLSCRTLLGVWGQFLHESRSCQTEMCIKSLCWKLYWKANAVPLEESGHAV